MILDFRCVTFYSDLDEKVFFDFVRQIKAIPPIRRRTHPQLFRVSRRVSREDLQSLSSRSATATTSRCDSLRRSLGPTNVTCFKNPRMHWYKEDKEVFARRARTVAGGEGRRTRR